LQIAVAHFANQGTNFGCANVQSKNDFCHRRYPL
jgi:hypothetical protein